MKNRTKFLALFIGASIMISCNEKKSVSTEDNKQTITKPETKQIKSESLTYNTDVVVPLNKEPENVASLEELFSKKELYANKSIIINGKVTKINNGIMNRNWIHISDGTQFEENKSLTITTLDTVAVGDLVTFKGTLVLNKDFGYNYVYDIILEQGELLQKTPSD